MRTSAKTWTILATLAAAGCGASNSGVVNPGYADEQYQAQVDAFNRQTEEQDEITRRTTKLLDQQELDFERTSKLIAQQESESQRINKILSEQESQADRYDRLLDKMEQQLRRQDAILDAQEKQLGIKK